MMLTEEDVSKSALRFLRVNYSERGEQRWEFEAVRWDGTRPGACCAAVLLLLRLLLDPTMRLSRHGLAPSALEGHPEVQLPTTVRHGLAPPAFHL